MKDETIFSEYTQQWEWYLYKTGEQMLWSTEKQKGKEINTERITSKHQ